MIIWLFVLLLSAHPALTEVKHHEKRLSQISDFDKSQMHHTSTVEKTTLPDKTGNYKENIDLTIQCICEQLSQLPLPLDKAFYLEFTGSHNNTHKMSSPQKHSNKTGNGQSIFIFV